MNTIIKWKDFTSKIGLGSCLTPLFRKHTVKLDYVTGNPNLPMTMNLATGNSMIISARTHLYDSIQISSRKAVTVHKYLKKYKNTLDGILVWVAMQAERTMMETET